MKRFSTFKILFIILFIFCGIIDSKGAQVDPDVWSSISCGNGFNVAIDFGGRIHAWGRNDKGQLGIGNTKETNLKTQIGTATNWKSVQAGMDHVLAIKTDGTIWAWGDNSKGQLGDGSFGGFSSTPKQIGTNKYNSISCGWNQCFAIDLNDKLVAWGDNSKGQLGDGTTVNKNAPIQIGSKSWKLVVSGNLHTIAIDNSNKMFAWGDNSKGQLGNNSTVNRNTPTQVGVSKTWGVIVAGNNQSWAIDHATHSIYGWGDYAGTNAKIPKVFKTGEDWRELYLFNKTLFVVNESMASFDPLSSIVYEPVHYVLGENQNGEFGIGNTQSSDTLIELPYNFNTIKIAAGFTHNAFLVNNNYKIFCMAGNNSYSQLGIIGPAYIAKRKCVAHNETFLIASDDSSDSKIKITWNLPVLEAHRSHNPEVYIQIRDYNTGKEIYSEILDSINNYDSIKGSTQLLVKHSEKNIYELRIIEYGPGTILYDLLTDYGSTLPYQKVSFNAKIKNPWSIGLGISSSSDYNIKNYVYRNDSLVGILDKSKTLFEESCDPLVSNNIKNGLSYTYKIKSVNDINEDSVWSDDIIVSSTIEVNFAASKRISKDSVYLTWNSLKGEVDKIVLRRDGLPLVELNENDQIYHDLNAIPGHFHSYEMELYLKEDKRLTLYDSGAIKPNGGISGYVINATDKGEFTIPNAIITANALVAGQEIILSTTTDVNGYYDFNDVMYYKSASYTLHAKWNGKSFGVNDLSVLLNLESPIKELNFVGDIGSLELDDIPFEVLGFTSNAIDSMGYVNLKWEFSNSDSVHYYLYRGDKLIEINHQNKKENSFIDLNGTPWVKYEYSIRAYARKYKKSLKGYEYIFADSKKDSARYPQPYAIQGAHFTVVANTTNATIDLNWVHPNGNINGFKVFRDGKYIQTISKGTNYFTDLTGQNGATYTYSINAFTTRRDTLNYNSSKVFAAPIKYPILQAPFNAKNSFSADGMPNILWDFTINSEYNFDGFKIFREYNSEKVEIGIVRKGLAKTIKDPSGVPYRNYTYKVIAFKKNITSESVSSNGVNISYPGLPKVQILTQYIKEGQFNFITDLNSNFHYLDIAIRNKAETKDFTLYRSNQYSVNLPWNDYKSPAELVFTAVKIIDGIKYYGKDTTLVVVNLKKDDPYDLDSVTNLSASNYYASHVKINWDYPNYFVPYFHIYRDGFLLDSIEGVHKTYYDHDLKDNKYHNYQVQVHLNGKKSRMNGTLGKTKGRTKVSGTIYTDQGKEGIKDVKVTLSILDFDRIAHEIYASTTTTSSGYYEFDEVATKHLESGYTLKVQAEHSNASFMESAKVLIFYDSIISYSANFVDTLPHHYLQEDTIAWPINISAVANVQDNSVEVTWQASNANYTSFEVYRGLVLLAIVPSGQTKFVLDNKGYPGYDYAYRIKPIWQKSRFEKIEGRTIGVSQVYPELLPVDQLNNSIVQDAVRVNWSHPIDMSMDYYVYRNGDLKKVVYSGENLEYLDSFGRIGKVYKYTVIAALSRNKEIQSLPMSTSASFPRVSKIKNISVFNIINGIELKWQRPSDRATHYKIYINDNIVDTFISFKQGEIIYNSYDGIPNAINEYSISAGYMESGLLYFGKKTKVKVHHSNLLSPNIYASYELTNQDLMRVVSKYKNLGVTGLVFYRGNTEAGRVKFEDKFLISNYVFDDGGGAPEGFYYYSIKAYSTRNGVTYFSNKGNQIYKKFPKLSAPTEVVFTNTDEKYNTISWKHNREDISIKIVKYNDCGGSNDVNEVPGTLNQYIDADSYDDFKMQYGVQAILNINGTDYTSKLVNSNILSGKGKALYMAGDGGFGGLGLGDQTDRLVPTKLGESHDWVKVSTGHRFTIAVKNNGTLWGWGSNSHGELGQGNTTNTYKPVQIGISADWSDVKCGETHVIALKNDGSLWSWGYNYEGQLGVDHTTNLYLPTRVGTDSNWSSIYAGYDNSFAIKTDGSLWGCGSSASDKLVNSTNRKVFSKIVNDLGWKKIAIGLHHILALKTNGTLYSWGANLYGQLGQGDNTYRGVPTKVNNNTNWTDVSSGAYHSMALQGQQLFVTGYNVYGQLGLGDKTHRNSFIQNGAGCSIFASLYSSYHINSSNDMYSAGRNDQGQLGLNDRNDKSDWERVKTNKYITGSSHTFHTAILLSEKPFSLFTASDGTYGSKVYLEWNDVTTYSHVKNIHIYRDGELISTESLSSTSYMDLDATPGKKHVYSIEINTNSGAKSASKSDIGWRTPNGVVKGNVISSVGNQPVPDVNVKMKVITEEGNNYYTATSDNNGNFRFEDVYYNTLADVIVTASYLNHEFVIDTLRGQMDETVTSLGIGTFIDLTANLIAGTVKRKGGDCVLDSIPVTLIKHYSSKADVEETKPTDEDGKYSYSVNPYEKDLISFELHIADTVFSGGDTIYHKWNRNNVVIHKSAVNTLTPEEHFIDLLGVDYKFSARNTCNTYPGVKFSLDITSLDGCFEKTILSNDNGSFPIENLPPNEYLVSINSASPLTASIIPVLEYLSVRPISLDLSDYDKNSKGDSTFKNLLIEKENFIFHKIPEISLNKKAGINNILCNPTLLRLEGAPNAVNVTIGFEVNETHDGLSCHVDEGYLVIKNQGATEANSTIYFDHETGSFPDYEFTPGLPATVAPYYKTMVVEYHTKQGFVSEMIYRLLIEGEAAQPGSDVIVDEDGNDFKIPLAVLRDPPGDKSYSYLEKGVESITTLKKTSSVGGSFTLSAQYQFEVVGIGFEINASAQAGGTSGKEDVITLSHKTTQRFETLGESEGQNSQATEYMVGDNSDVIVGTGMALKYGIVESIEYHEGTASDGSDSCFIRKVNKIGLSPDKLKTTWVYNVSHIESLIEEYQYALELARQGRLTFEDNSEEGRDTSFYTTLINNWTEVLNYHRKNTLPHYNLCDPDVFDDKFGGSVYESIARSYQEDCFCNELGSYSDGEFIMDPDFKWTNDMLDRYRVARSKMDQIYDQVLVEDSEFTSKRYDGISIESYDESDFSDYVDDLTDEEKKYAENITFSANTSTEKSYSTSVSSSNTFSQSAFGDFNIYAGFFGSKEFEVGSWVGFGGGAFLATGSTLEFEDKIGGNVNVNFEYTWEEGTENITEESSGFVLSDDDAGDQFSVTVIKGLENSHTPYFELFAGRSSCPYEPGSIARDRPQLTLEYPDGTAVNNAQYDVNPEDAAFYPIKISNLAPETFNEPRYYFLTQAPNSNQFGAQLTADGSGQYYPLVYSVLSGQSTYTGFYANKAGSSYDYPDLNMQLIPTCFDAAADIVDGFNGAALNMEAYFRKPCSNISILDPTDNWRIIRTRDEFGNPKERLQVQVGDYDPENEFLEKITMEYRRIGTSEWRHAIGMSVDKDSLQRYFQETRSIYKDPVYNFIWDVFDNEEIIDGNYEIKAIVHCGIEGKIESNISKGVIDRTAIALFGTPKPTDGVLNIGEDVEVLFNEPIECGFENKSMGHYSFVRISDGMPLEFTPVCNLNSIIYNFDGDLDSLDNEVISMRVFEVQDLNGNKLIDTIKYEFVVSRTPVSWNPYSFEVNVYKGQSQYVELQLVNSGELDATVNVSNSGTPGNLVDLQLANAIIQKNATIQVPIQVNAQGVNIGTYNYTLSSTISTTLKNYGIKTIPLKINVLPVPPSWTAPTGMPLSTVVICNFKLDSIQSIDSMDRIAITMDNEIRGFDNIYQSKANPNLYYAVINVQGNTPDLGKSFQYRVWDASEGVEYDGVMTNGAIKFDGANYGTTLNPRIINVESKWDSVRYIALHKGWNWLAFNYKKESMNVNNMLRGLNLQGGEIIKTLNKQAVYNTTTKKWFATSGGLVTINSADGYLLFLNQDDVLRASGDHADKKLVVIDTGWNLIGNPYQSNRDINNVFQTNVDIKTGAILKTGGLTNKASVFDGGSWNGGITAYEMNRSYMLLNEKKTQIQFRSTDCEKLRKGNFQYNMTFLASVRIDGQELQEIGDYVVAKIDGVCRGRGFIEEVNTPSRRFVLNMFVYGDTADLGKEVHFEIYRKNTNQTLTAYIQDTIKFTPDLHRGAPNYPFLFSNNPEFVGIKDNLIDSELNFNIYPNPFTNSITFDIKADFKDIAEIEIYDLLGKKVYMARHFCMVRNNKFTIHPKDFAKGIYTVCLKINGKTQRVKMIKK